MAKALLSVVILMAIKTAILFAVAGTLQWWQAWLYLALYGAMSVAITVYLAVHDPALLARRMKGGSRAEVRPAQRVIMAIVSVAWIGLMVIPALDYRFGWSRMPDAVIIVGDALLLAGYAGIWRVFAENTYTAATVRVEADQTLVDTGPYALVRHPMYTTALLMLLGMPLALGSWWALLLVAVIAPLLGWRIADEERALVEDLAGYADYRLRVRWKLVPGLY